MTIELSAPDDVTGQDNRLSFTDQAMFLGLRATGQESAMLGVWIYERPVDMAGLRRFHRDFGHGLWGRLIEPSPLPFGRHRWVSASGPAAPLAVAEVARPREELSDWVDERVQLPLDPQHGPGWHLGVQPFTDGSTAVCLVASHCLGDGFGSMLAVYQAITGTGRDLGYPLPGSRTRWRGGWADLAGAVRGLPEVGRALAAGAKQAARRRGDLARSKPPRPGRGAPGGEPVMTPTATAFLDTAQWDARAAALGAASPALVAAVAARLAEHMGRRRDEDGAVTLIVPIADRGPDDTRANAVVLGSATVDPVAVHTDLRGVRDSVREAIRTARETPDAALQLLPLIPFVPKRAVARGANALFNFADLPVSCSNVGELPPEIACIDGTPADYAFQRGVDRRVTRQALEQRHGLLTVVSSRMSGRIIVDVVAYQPGAENSKPWLRELLSRTLAEFDLTGVVS